MKANLKVGCRMSTEDFKAIVVSAPNTDSPSSTPVTNPDANPILTQSISSDSQLDKQMLIKDDNSSEQGVNSPGFHADLPSQSSQSSSTPPDIGLSADYTTSTFNFPYGNSRQTNLFLLTSDGNFASLSPHQVLDMKDLEKIESSGVILSSRPLSNSSLSVGSTASPKPYMPINLNENKNDKMISGFDSRVDGFSPLSVIAVSAYQDSGHTSPSLLTRHGHPVLRYNTGGGDAMLSALNYSESDMLQEGGFDVPSSGTFNSLDNLLGSGIGGSSAPGMRLPDLLDGEISQETYMETGQDLTLSPQTFSAAGESFTVGESTSLSNLADTNDSLIMTTTTTREPIKIPETNNNLLMVDKLKVKNNRPVKATSPNRPGTQPCPTCGKVFSNSSALTKHKLTHSDERKYVCPLCAKAFKRQDHLNGHMLTHRNKKPFECDAEGCGKSYCDARSLRRHKENHHSSSQSNLTTSIAVTSLGKSVAVIPGLAHLANFNSLQSSFPASVITSNTNSSNSETTIGNRIQYAPPPPVTSVSAPTSVISSDAVSKVATSNSIIGSIIPTVTSHLQFLTFHQQAVTKSSVLSSSTSTVTSAASKVDRTVLATWPSQTINTGALLLTQNLENSQHSTKSAQFLAEAFNLPSSTVDNAKSVPSALSNLADHNNLLTDVKKPLTFVTEIKQETESHELSSSKDFLDKCKDNHFSSDKSNSQRLNLTVVSGPNTIKDSPFSSDAKLLQDQNKNQKNNASVPTTPISKEPSISFQMESPLLQQLLNQQQNLDINRISQNYGDLSFLSTLSEQGNSQSTNLSQSSRILIPQWSQVKSTAITTTTATNRQSNTQDPKPVECSLCQRKFKNVPALNGHMRLHGGYFKKDNDGKKIERRSSTTIPHQPLVTASTNIRALIEEKIIQKRNFGSQLVSPHVVENNSTTAQTINFTKTEIIPEPSPPFVAQPSPILSPVTQEPSDFSDFSVSQNSSSFDLIPTQNNHDLSYDWLKKLDLKHQFRVPHPPAEKHRRHSDSDHFIPSKRPCTSYTSSALADLLRRKVVAKRTSRTGSDPGEPLIMDDANSISDLSSSLLDFFPKFSTNVSLSLRHSLDDTVLHHDDLSTAGEDSILPILSAEDIPDAQPAMTGLKDVTEIDSNCLDKSVFFETSNTDMPPVGQPLPEISVSELEMMQLTTVVTSASTTPLHIEAPTNDKSRAGEDCNDDDDVFLSPISLPTSPMKVKRKHKPEPLYIPPYVNTCGFTSRLRSPRLWDPSHPDHKKLSPPPYTPPPMLSPVRSGSGLFWHIISGSGNLTPKSAPITPSFGLNRKNSIGEMAYEEEEESLGEAPESDVLPHVNIGSFYQAKLPQRNSNFKEALYVKHKADQVWDPSTMDHLSEEEVEAFVELACCAAVPGGGRNKEYALHLLHLHKGKIQDAILALLNSSPKLPVNHALLTYQYSESDKWSPEEIEAYHQGLLRCDKDFFSIAKDIPTKTVKQCVQFYYLWKKVCPDEYKRIRMIRRRKEQESLYYNLRSKEEEDGEKRDNVSPVGNILQENTSEEIIERDMLSNGQIATQNCSDFSKVTSTGKKTYDGATSIVLHPASAYDFHLDPVEEFPCKICGKVFSKVKSRSAHMKSHRPPDSDKKIKNES